MANIRAVLLATAAVHLAYSSAPTSSASASNQKGPGVDLGILNPLATGALNLLGGHLNGNAHRKIVNVDNKRFPDPYRPQQAADDDNNNQQTPAAAAPPPVGRLESHLRPPSVNANRNQPAASSVNSEQHLTGGWIGTNAGYQDTYIRPQTSGNGGRRQEQPPPQEPSTAHPSHAIARPVVFPKPNVNNVSNRDGQAGHENHGNASSGNREQRVTLYTGTGLHGVSVEMKGQYCPDLSKCFEVSLDDAVSSAKLTGIWVLFSGYSYGLDDELDVEWIWGDNYMHNLHPYVDDKVSSLRFIGAADDYTADTLTLFSQNYFKGWEYFAVEGETGLRGWQYEVQSAAVTGSSPWTIYELENYQGTSKCLYPWEGGCPGLYPISTKIGLPTVRSIRKGCFSDARLSPAGLPAYAGGFLPPSDGPVLRPWDLTIEGRNKDNETQSYEKEQPIADEGAAKEKAETDREKPARVQIKPVPEVRTSSSAEQEGTETKGSQAAGGQTLPAAVRNVSPTLSGPISSPANSGAQIEDPRPSIEANKIEQNQEVPIDLPSVGPASMLPHLRGGSVPNLDVGKAVEAARKQLSDTLGRAGVVL